MADSAVDLWATDEVHFQQHGSRCRMWVPPETRDPVLLHHPTRHSVGYFGAVRLRDGSFQFRRETDKFNGLTFFEFMKELYQTQRQQRPSRGGDHGQRQIPPRPVTSAVAGRTRRRVRAGLPATLQPGVESDRASVETDSAALLAQPLLSPCSKRSRPRWKRSSPTGPGPTKPARLCAIT